LRTPGQAVVAPLEKGVVIFAIPFDIGSVEERLHGRIVDIAPRLEEIVSLGAKDQPDEEQSRQADDA
jgi:hypothetical protein